MSSPFHRDLGGADRFRFSTPILGLLGLQGSNLIASAMAIYQRGYLQPSPIVAPALLGSNQEPAVLETAALPIAPRAIA